VQIAAGADAGGVLHGLLPSPTIRGYTLDDPGEINPDYTGVPTIGLERLEIQLIEATARGRGSGSRVVQMLAERYQNRRLFAYSQDTDSFRARLGWERFRHPEGDWRALFIQPGN
jgi:hypothetical protein